jgi:predicted RNA-binding Zn ribbon-like protein
MPEQINPPPAPGEDTSTALALVNTELQPRGRPLDLLTDAGALAAWLRARGLKRARAAAISDSELDQMRQLRSAIRAAFTARAAGRRPTRAVIAAINHAAALAASNPQLRWTGDGPGHTRIWDQDAPPAEVALAQISANAISTLQGDRGDRVRLCEAHGCSRMFIADHRRRRWCSKACGDRVRVRHYRKLNSAG